MDRGYAEIDGIGTGCISRNKYRSMREMNEEEMSQTAAGVETFAAVSTEESTSAAISTEEQGMAQAAVVKPIPKYDDVKCPLKMNRNQLKYLLIIAMLIDHIAWAFVPTASVLGQVMHFIGRLTGPTMSLLLGEGYYYTRNRKKYALRLGIFALISCIPFSLFESGKVFSGNFGMIYTLFIAFMTVWMWDKLKVPKAVKAILVMVACILSVFGDWPIFAVLWALFSYIYRERPVAKWVSFSIVAAFELMFIIILPMMGVMGVQSWLSELFQFGIILVPITYIIFYGGKVGSKAPVHKWFFYVFYPAHLFILYLIKLALRA